jgi:exosortase
VSVEGNSRIRLVRLPAPEIALVAVGVVFLYYPLALYLSEKWKSLPEFSHGYLIPLISLYLVWRRREAIAAAPRAPSALGVLIAGASLVLLLAANLGAIKTVACYSFITLLIGIVLAVWGKHVLKLVLFPLVFMVFMIPIFTFILTPITFSMKIIAAKLATGTVKALGVSIYREGAVLYLPNAVIEVADACSGIRSLFALLALGAVYAYLFQGKAWERLSLFLVGIPIAIGANYVRVTFLTLVAYQFGVDASLPGEGWFAGGRVHPGTIVHDVSGFSVFVIAFTLLFSVGRFLEWRRPASTAG